MNTKDLIRLGVQEVPTLKLGMDFIRKVHSPLGDPSSLEEEVARIVANPAAILGDPLREAFARSLYELAFKQRETLASCWQWARALNDVIDTIYCRLSRRRECLTELRKQSSPGRLLKRSA